MSTVNVKWKIKGAVRSALSIISPKLNNMVTYRIKFGKKLDLNNPQTLNEKLLWLKFNYYWNNRDLICLCADKYRVRKYIEEKGFGYLLNSLIGVYEDVNDIIWDQLPQSFVIKSNVGFGHNIVVKDKKSLNINKTKKVLRRWLKDNYQYLNYYEIQYKDIKHYILIEKYIGDAKRGLPSDYKFYCMNGKCKTIMYCDDRIIGRRASYYFMDTKWNLLPYTEEALHNPTKEIPKPQVLNNAIEIAESLSKDFPFVRVDLYLLDDKIYFGELTFTPAAAFDSEIKLIPPGSEKSVDQILGEQLILPISKRFKSHS